MNIIKLFTAHGAIYVDSAQLAGKRTILTIYTARGKKLSDSARTHQERIDAGFGVHRDNLYASPELAEAAYERIIADMAQRAAA